MTWISPRERLPKQGLKVLCFNEGDLWVAQRFGEHWFPIPFCDSKFASFKAPKLWKHVEFPEPFKGLMTVSVDGEVMEMDEFEKKHPKQFCEFIEAIKKSMGKKR